MNVIHNQGKQAFKRIRRKLGLTVNREPLPPCTLYLFDNGSIRSEVVNDNPILWDQWRFREVKLDK